MTRLTPQQVQEHERKLKSDPVFFRRNLLVKTDNGPRRLGQCMDDWQQRDFLALDPGWKQVVTQRDVKGARSLAWLQRPRGHAKTADIATMATWALCSSPRPIHGVVAADDRDQARLILNKITELVYFNKGLARILDVQANKVVNTVTKSWLDALSNDAPSSYGLTPDFVIVDELANWKKGSDLWSSLFDAHGKSKRCMLVVISNAGFSDTWQHALYESLRNDLKCYFHSLDGPQASWITPETIEEKRKHAISDQHFRRVWLNEWSAGAGDALAESDITAALTLDGPTDQPEREWAYVAGLDLGVTRDATVLAVLGIHLGWTERKAKDCPALSHAARLIAESDESFSPPADDDAEYVHHEGTGRVKLVALQVWMPAGDERIDLSEVEATVAAMHDRYNLSSVAADPWQAEHLTQRLQAAGIPVEGVHFTPQSLQAMATAMMDAFRERQIDLFPDKLLLADLQNLQVVEKPGGFRLQSPRGSKAGTPHGDSATALMLGLYAAREFNLSPPASVQGPLVCWPQ